MRCLEDCVGFLRDCASLVPQSDSFQMSCISFHFLSISRLVDLLRSLSASLATSMNVSIPYLVSISVTSLLFLPSFLYPRSGAQSDQVSCMFSFNIIELSKGRMKCCVNRNVRCEQEFCSCLLFLLAVANRLFLSITCTQIHDRQICFRFALQSNLGCGNCFNALRIGFLLQPLMLLYSENSASFMNIRF